MKSEARTAEYPAPKSVRELLKSENAEEVLHRNYKYCDCEIPHVARKWHAALGVFVEIRLCCLAKAVEKLTGESFYEAFEFEPEWVWDCNEMTRKQDGSMRRKGNPPTWLQKRMLERGIEIKNLR